MTQKHEQTTPEGIIAQKILIEIDQLIDQHCKQQPTLNWSVLVENVTVNLLTAMIAINHKNAETTEALLNFVTNLIRSETHRRIGIET